MKKVIIILLLLITSKLSAQDSNWIYMYNRMGTKGEYSNYYNLNSLTYEGSAIIVYIKHEPLFSEYEKDENGVEQEVEHKLIKTKIFCGKRMSAALQFITYYKNGQVRTHNSSNPFLNAGTEITPGTNGEKEYLFFCFK